MLQEDLKRRRLAAGRKTKTLRVSSLQCNSPVASDHSQWPHLGLAASCMRRRLSLASVMSWNISNC